MAPPGDGAIPAFLEEVGARKQPLAAHLEQAASLRFAPEDGGRLLIHLPPGEAYLSPRLRQQANREIIGAAVAAVWGAGARWELAEGTPPASPASRPAAGSGGAGGTAPQPARMATAAAAAAMDPAVQTLLDIFGGKVEAVEEHRGSREE